MSYWNHRSKWDTDFVSIDEALEYTGTPLYSARHVRSFQPFWSQSKRDVESELTL